MESHETLHEMRRLLQCGVKPPAENIDDPKKTIVGEPTEEATEPTMSENMKRMIETSRLLNAKKKEQKELEDQKRKKEERERRIEIRKWEEIRQAEIEERERREKYREDVRKEHPKNEGWK